jgi:sigma-B regulation protein RsbU (phosphoserine phosphatase)
MAMIRAVVHTFGGDLSDPPGVLHHINRHFNYLWGTSMFATVLYGVLDADRRTLRLSCAGHPPPILIRRGADPAPLPVHAVLPLLFRDLGDIPCFEQALDAGDRLAFYTDGVTDRQARDGSMYDQVRLMTALQPAATLDPVAALERVVADLETFAAGHEATDDQTLVIVSLGA